MEGEKGKREGGRREKKRREEEGEGKKDCQPAHLLSPYAHPSHTYLDLLLIYPSCPPCSLTPPHSSLMALPCFQLQRLRTASLLPAPVAPPTPSISLQRRSPTLRAPSKAVAAAHPAPAPSPSSSLLQGDGGRPEFLSTWTPRRRLKNHGIHYFLRFFLCLN
jgi:hypothetical protein